MRNHSKRLFTTFSLFTFLALLPMSCGLFCNDSCGCGPIPKPSQLVVQSFSTQTIDSSGKVISDTETKPYDQIFKTLRIDQVESKKQTLNTPIESGSFGSAYACDPAPARTHNMLSIIQIINQKDTELQDGTILKPGENISSYFGMTHFSSSELITFADFLNPEIRLTLDDHFKIGFIQDPKKELNLKFTIRILFDDRQEFLLTDQILNVQ